MTYLKIKYFTRFIDMIIDCRANLYMLPDWSTAVSAIGKWLLKDSICRVFLKNVTVVGLLHISTSLERTEFFLIANAFSASFGCKLARCLVILVQVVYFFTLTAAIKWSFIYNS